MGVKGLKYTDLTHCIGSPASQSCTAKEAYMPRRDCNGIPPFIFTQCKRGNEKLTHPWRKATHTAACEPPFADCERAHVVLSMHCRACRNAFFFVGGSRQSVSTATPSSDKVSTCEHAPGDDAICRQHRKPQKALLACQVPWAAKLSALRRVGMEPDVEQGRVSTTVSNCRVDSDADGTE